MRFDKNKLNDCIAVRSDRATCEPFCIMPNGTIQHECKGCEYDPVIRGFMNTDSDPKIKGFL